MTAFTRSLVDPATGQTLGQVTLRRHSEPTEEEWQRLLDGHRDAAAEPPPTQTPLEEQVRQIKAELDELQHLKSDVEELKQLREDVELLKARDAR